MNATLFIHISLSSKLLRMGAISTAAACMLKGGGGRLRPPPPDCGPALTARPPQIFGPTYYSPLQIFRPYNMPELIAPILILMTQK